MTHEERIFYTELGICPICHKNRLFGDEKSCLECRADRTNKKAFSRSTNRQLYNAYMKALKKRLYDERKTKYICVECGKRDAKCGRVRCEICLEKKAEKARMIRYKKEELLNK